MVSPVAEDPRHRKGLEERFRVPEFARWIWDRVAPGLGERVLEVGCGRAPLVPWIRRDGLDYLGIDASEETIAANRRHYDGSQRVRFRAADFLEDPPMDAIRELRPDTVLCLNVLEHVEDDGVMVGRFREYLEPGGRLVVQVPAHPWLYGTNDRAMGHRRRYRAGDLRELLSHGGFRAVEVQFFNRLGVLPWWIQGTVLGRRAGYFEGQSDRSLALHNRLIPLVRGFEAVFSLPLGLSLLGFARRD